MIKPKIIDEILLKYNSSKIDYDVYIIADAQGLTARETDDRICHASEDEFFSRIEFAEIASALFNVFGFAKVFYSEISFIEYFISHNVDPSKCIVYNLARDGRKRGKKSLIPAFCDMYNLRYTGSDAFVISLLRNKPIYTDLLSLHNITTPKSTTYSILNDNFEDILLLHNGKDIIVKNPYESASIGLSEESKIFLTQEKYELFRKISKRINPTEVFVQEYIEGEECEVLVIQYRNQYYSLTPVLIQLPDGKTIIDSNVSNNYQYSFSVMDNKISKEICKIAEKAASILKIKDYARFDFRVKNGIPYLFDIAGTPYTIHHSSIAYIFSKYGYEYKDIYKVIVTCMLSNNL